MPFTEANFENAIIELFCDQLGYDYLYGPDVVRDYMQPLHLELLRASLYNINFRLLKVISENLLPKLIPEELSVKHIAQ